MIPFICTELSVCEAKDCFLGFFIYFIQQQITNTGIYDAHYRNVIRTINYIQILKLYCKFKRICIHVYKDTYYTLVGLCLKVFFCFMNCTSFIIIKKYHVSTLQFPSLKFISNFIRLTYCTNTHFVWCHILPVIFNLYSLLAEILNLVTIWHFLTSHISCKYSSKTKCFLNWARLLSLF